MYPNSESALVAYRYIFEYPIVPDKIVWDSSARIVIAGVCEQHKPTFRQYQQGFNAFNRAPIIQVVDMGEGSYFRPEVSTYTNSHIVR